MISNLEVSQAMSVKLEDIFDELPEMPEFVEGIRRAPKRELTLNQKEVELALKNALEFGATAIILAHNHPSGALHPSVADKQITQKLKKASASIDIRLLDHIIVTHTSYFSFADEGLL